MASAFQAAPEVQLCYVGTQKQFCACVKIERKRKPNRKRKKNDADAGQGYGRGMDAAEPRAGAGVSAAPRRFGRLGFRPGDQRQTVHLSEEHITRELVSPHEKGTKTVACFNPILFCAFFCFLYYFNLLLADSISTKRGLDVHLCSAKLQQAYFLSTFQFLSFFLYTYFLSLCFTQDIMYKFSFIYWVACEL